MAKLDLPRALAEINQLLSQLRNTARLITFQGKNYKLNTKTGSYEADGKSFTKAQLRSKIEGQHYSAPKDKNIKIKKTPTTTKTKTTPKTSVKTKVSQAANNVKNVGKNLKIKKLPVKGGAVSIAAGLATELGINRQGTDRIARQLAGKSKMTMQEFRAERDKKLKEREQKLFKGAKRTNKRPTGAERNKIIASRKRVTTTDDYEHGRSKTYKGKTTYWNKNTKSWQTNKPGPFIKKSPYQSTTQKSTTPTRAEKLKQGMRTWRTDSEEQKKLNKGETSKKDIKINSNKTDKEVSGGNTGGTTATTKLTPAQKEERAKKKWLEKTRNSPAQKSGAFDPNKLWELHKHHQGFKKARKEGTLKEWRKKNKRK